MAQVPNRVSLATILDLNVTFALFDLEKRYWSSRQGVN